MPARYTDAIWDTAFSIICLLKKGNLKKRHTFLCEICHSMERNTIIPGNHWVSVSQIHEWIAKEV